jgi:cell division septation protein DedD
LIGISSVFAALLFSGLGLGLYFKRDVSVGPLLEPPPPVAVAPTEAPAPTESTPDVGGARISAMAARATKPRIGVRVGIFAVVANAERMERQLRAAGYDPMVVLVNPDGRALRYVYAGAFETESEAITLAVTLEAQGMDSWLEVVVGEPP